MSLTDLLSKVPGGNDAFAASDPIGAKKWFNGSGQLAKKEKFSNFSTQIFGKDWFKIFPYQFILIDKSDIAPAPEEYDEATAPSQFTPSSTALPGPIASLSPSAAADFDRDANTATNESVVKRKAYEKNYKAKRKQRLAEEDSLAKKVVYTLPIPPDGLSVQPMIASEVMASLGGIVEETSPTAFWMITLSGTTGMAIGRTDTDTTANIFRDALGTTGLLSGLGSALNKLASTVTNIGNSFDALSADPSPGGVADLAAAALLPKLPYSKSAVDVRNGYLEIHLLHRFLNAYGDMKALKPDAAKLVFCNYKDGQQWQVIVKSFKITKSVNEPMLYRYSIVLQGWDMKDPSEAQGAPVDRFKTDLKSVNTTTLTGLVSSANHLVANTIGSPNNIVPVVL